MVNITAEGYLFVIFPLSGGPLNSELSHCARAPAPFSTLTAGTSDWSKLAVGIRGYHSRLDVVGSPYSHRNPLIGCFWITGNHNKYGVKSLPGESLNIFLTVNKSPENNSKQKLMAYNEFYLYKSWCMLFPCAMELIVKQLNLH